MKPDALRKLLLVALVAAVVAAGCGDDNTATPTPAPASPTLARTATPTATPTPAPPTASPSPTTTSGSGAVTGLLVLGHDVNATTSDALGSPPQQWAESADAKAFDRSLAAANWSIDGEMQGVTGPDGRFTVDALPAGPHTLQISKTLDGNLASASIPFTVGDNGSADLIAEVSWGQVKSITTYTQDGAQVREVRAPNGNWTILRDGRIGRFGDWTRTFVDANGDGSFAVTPCLDSTGSTPPDSTEPCNEGQACDPGERCVCVPSCPSCDDCLKSVCTPSCSPVDITRLDVSGPSQMVVGQQGSMSATAQLSDGSTFDVTYLVEWTSSDSSIATVDSWGTVTALQVGSTSIAATFGTVNSTPWPLQVTARPTLRKIDVQNVSCFFPLGAPTAGEALPADAVPSARSDILPVPNCTQVVPIGGTIQFRAIGEFDNGYYQDITDEAQWQVTPPEVGSVVAGLFTGLQAGTAMLTASLAGVTSDATEIRVVTQPTVIGLTIYAENSGFPVVAMGGAAPVAVASGMPCLMAAPSDASGAPCCCPGPMVNSDAPCRCVYSITALVGDQLQFHATAQYDTGEWKDVTTEVTWKSSDSSVASIDTGGVMNALQAGDTAITAALDTITSDPANVHVVDHATLQSIWIYQEGQDRVVAKGDQRFFHAMGSYDIGISREVTTDATWKSSDPSVGGFDTPGVFIGRGAGDVQVWAELDSVKSNQLSVEVFETSELSYCDPNNINRAVWSDDFNRVILESDCAWYNQPGLATLRYTVTEIQPHGGIFNPCLDLYVFAGQTKVRTIRNEGCGDPFLAANAPGRDQEAVKYQLRAFWDLKDDSGNPVAPGTYTIYGRFYLYYDPVVSLDVTVLAPNQPTPTPRPSNAISPTTTPTPTFGKCDVCDGRACMLPSGTSGKCLVQPDGCACVPVSPEPITLIDAGAVSAPPGTTAVVPISIQLPAGTSCATMQFNLTVAPKGGALAVDTNVAFASLVGAPSLNFNDGPATILVGWLSDFSPLLTGTVQVGTLSVSIPAAALDGQAYVVEVINPSGTTAGGIDLSMNGVNGLITVGGCSVACDGRPCSAVCPDGQNGNGTCSGLTADGGCECTADCALVETPTPTPNRWGCGDVCDGRPCPGGACIIPGLNGCFCEGPPTPTATPRGLPT